MTSNTTINHVNGNRITTTTTTATNVINHPPSIIKNTQGTISGTTFGSNTGMRVNTSRSVSRNAQPRYIAQTVTQIGGPPNPMESSQPYSGPILEGLKTTMPLNQSKSKPLT